MKCIFSNRPATAYWREGDPFEIKRCPCGARFKLDDAAMFPGHSPMPKGQPEGKDGRKPRAKTRSDPSRRQMRRTR